MLGLDRVQHRESLGRHSLAQPRPQQLVLALVVMMQQVADETQVPVHHRHLLDVAG